MNIKDITYEELFNLFIKKDMSGKQIAELYSCNFATVYKKLKKFGIKKTRRRISEQLPKEDIAELYKKFVSIRDIGLHYNVSEAVIRECLVSMDIQIRSVGQKSITNQSFLECIDSEEKAYLLGFLLSDGSITGKNSAGNYSTISLELQTKDKYILERFRDEFSKLSSVKDTQRGTSYWRVHGVELVKSVEKYGLVPNKSKKLDSLLDYNLIPEKYYRHYIRGLFDGDGTANSAGIIGYNAANKAFVESYRNFLVKKLGVKQNGIYFGTVYFTSWGAKLDREKIYHYLYDNANIFLVRKKDKIESFVNR